MQIHVHVEVHDIVECVVQHKSVELSLHKILGESLIHATLIFDIMILTIFSLRIGITIENLRLLYTRDLIVF